jgi:RHS repeat-associated protein
MLTLQNIATSNTYTREFNYTTHNNYLNSIDIGVNNYEFTFDENGNQITENSSRKFEWDFSDKLKCFYDQIGTAQPTIYEHYLYDASGNRTKKLTRKSGGTIEVSIYIDGILDYQYHKNSSGTVTAENNTLHIMDDKSRIANLRVGTAFSGDTTPEIQYNLEDHLGSSNVRIDENGTVIDRDEFYPFGETSLHTFNKKRYRYVGKERDEYSGMYYYGARYYAAWTCRFVSVDPLAGKYAQLTPYNYAGNKPINYIDVDGMQSNGGDEQSPTSSNKEFTYQNVPESKIDATGVASVEKQYQTLETNNLSSQPQNSNVIKDVLVFLDNLLQGYGDDSKLHGEKFVVGDVDIPNNTNNNVFYDALPDNNTDATYIPGSVAGKTPMKPNSLEGAKAIYEASKNLSEGVGNFVDVYDRNAKGNPSSTKTAEKPVTPVEKPWKIEVPPETYQFHTDTPYRQKGDSIFYYNDSTISKNNITGTKTRIK